MAYCKVKNCRYAATHTTVAHKCGTCGGYGHGQIECVDPVAIRHLSFFFPETVAPDDRCGSPLCSNRATHTTAGHTCRYCDVFAGEHLRHCPNGLNAGSISITDDPLSIGFDPRPNAETLCDEKALCRKLYGEGFFRQTGRASMAERSGGVEMFNVGF